MCLDIHVSGFLKGLQSIKGVLYQDVEKVDDMGMYNYWISWSIKGFMFYTNWGVWDELLGKGLDYDTTNLILVHVAIEKKIISEMLVSNTIPGLSASIYAKWYAS